MKTSEYRDLFGNKNTSHASRGAAFEDALELLHRRKYETGKTAFIRKNNLDWVYTTERDIRAALDAKRISPAQCAKTFDGKFLVARQTKPDFEGGCLFGNHDRAVHVIFDAKQTKNKSLPLSMLKTHQIELLAIAQQRGSIAGFMIWFSEADRVFFLSALAARQIGDKAKFAARKNGRAASGTQSISIKTLELIAIEVEKTGGFWDWREALKVLVKK